MITAPINWTENIILVDADHVDKVTFNLIVNFERMIGRRIPQADIAKWLDCIALDGGIREGEHQIQVVLLHGKEKNKMENFLPSIYGELDGKAFKDHLGEFIISALPVEKMTTKEDFFLDALQMACGQKEVKRVMVIANETLFPRIKDLLRRVDDEKRITIFNMEPREGGNFRQEILGYSLMAALGIKGDEIKAQ